MKIVFFLFSESSVESLFSSCFLFVSFVFLICFLFSVAFLGCLTYLIIYSDGHHQDVPP